MNVKVLKLGSAAKEMTGLDTGVTIGGVLEQANLATAGYSVSLNGLGAGIDAEVTDGDIITLVPKVEGGR